MFRRDNFPPPYIPPEHRSKKYSDMPPEYQKAINVWVNKTTTAAASHAYNFFVAGAVVVGLLIVVVLGAVIAAVSKTCG